MNIAVILAAGIGSRMKQKLPKQFIEINNKPLFIFTLEKFLSVQQIDKIILVINKNYEDLYKQYLLKFDLLQNIELVNGGQTRQESVSLSLDYLSDKAADNDIVTIHDGARPLVSPEIILNNIITCQKNQNAVSTVINIVDTIIDKEYNLVDKDSLWAVQTPQTFPYKLIKLLHAIAKDKNLFSVSDDAQLAKKFGYKVNYVLGSRLNIKITEEEDIYLLKILEK